MPPEWTLTPDEPEAAADASTRPVRLVSSGLAPTAEMPTGKRAAKPTPVWYAPCPHCAVMVLTGRTADGKTQVLDPAIDTYTVLWLAGTAQPELAQSRAYPVHQCLERAARKEEKREAQAPRGATSWGPAVL